MSQQSEIFARYRSLFNSKSFRPLENETSRRLNNMDFVDFLFELVKATKGQKQFKNIILKGSLSKLKKVDELNKVITKSLFNQFGCDNTIVIPTKYTTKSSLGIEINKNEIDAFGLLGIDPNTKPGNYMYEGDNPTQHVNFLLYKAQGILKENAALSISYKSNVLFNIYSKNPNTFVFRFGEFYENKKFNVWLNDYLALTNPVFNMVNFTTILTDLITGAISIKTNKSKLEIRKQNSTILGIQKIFGFCSEAPVDGGASENSANQILKKELDANFNGDTSIGQPIGIGGIDSVNNNQNVNPFDFNFNDLDEIERNTYLRSNNQIRFSTCGNLDLDINPDDIIAGLDELFNNSNINIPESYDGISNNQTQLSNTRVTTTSDYDNSEITPNVTKSADFFDNALKNGAQKAIDLGETNVIIDLPNMNAELQLNILKAIPYALMQMVLTPKIVMVPKLFAVLIDDNTTKTTNDLLNSMTGSIQTIGTTVTNLLIQNIFDAIKSDLTNLAKELALAFLRQRGVDYLSTLKSLLGILGLLGSSSGCKTVLDKLLDILKFSSFGPMPMLPPPLILVAGGIKPGMNSVAMINDIKSNLTEKGIETAPTLPDGTPNNMMIAIEETVRTMVSHIKTNSTIQTFGIGATGPVQGYGQIQ
jgi:hypothetical protein